MATIGGYNVVTDGLVLSLDAANRRSYVSGSLDWRDLSGTIVTGSLVNGPTFNSGNGGSIVFDGSNDNINLGDPTSLNITGSVSIESWVYPTDVTTGAFKKIAGRWDDNKKSYKIAIISSNSKFYIDVSRFGTEDIYIQSDQSAIANVWQYIVGTYTSGASPSLNIYVNGQLSNGTLIGTVPSSLYSGTSTFYIGVDNVANANPYAGRIATTRVYNRALSPTEVLQNYNAQKGRFGL
jgi:hypothetical protein